MLVVIAVESKAAEPMRLAMNTRNTNQRVEVSVGQTARSLKIAAHAEISAAIPSISNLTLRQRVEAAATAVLKALNDKSWVDDNHVDRASGSVVFTHDEAAVHQLTNLLDNDDVPAALQSRINAAASKLSESIRILTQSVNGVLQAGDIGRAEGNYQGAIRAYKRAWLSAQ
jgi:hypothetical protein